MRVIYQDAFNLIWVRADGRAFAETLETSTQNIDILVRHFGVSCTRVAPYAR